MATHRKSTRASSGDFTIEKTKSSSPATEVAFEKSIPDASTNLEFSIFVESTGLKSFSIWADKSMTVKTNSSSTPQETFTLNGTDFGANWIDPEASPPIAGDVTTIFVTNSSGAAGTLKLLAGWG